MNIKYVREPNGKQFEQRKGKEACSGRNGGVAGEGSSEPTSG